MTLKDFPDADPSITLDFLKSKQLDPRITFSRASSGGADGTGSGIVNGEVYIFQENVPRLTDKGLLLEKNSTNYLLNSATLVTQTVAIPSTGRWMLSFYGTGTVVVSGANSGTLTGTGANERVSLFLGGTTISNMTLTVTGTVTNAQLEPGDRLTSYIPTTTATVTRVADILEVTGTDFSSWWNESQGTIVFEKDAPGGSGTVYYYELSDSSRNERHIYTDSGSSSITTAGDTYNYAVGGTKLALGFATDNTNVCTDGNLQVLDTSCDMPTGITRMTFAKRFDSNSFRLESGYFQRFAFYPTRLPDNSLEALTTQ